MRECHFTRREFLKFSLLALTSACVPEQIINSPTALPVLAEGKKQWEEGSLLLPVAICPNIIRGFSSDHTAVDFAEELDNPVVSSISGTVAYSSEAVSDQLYNWDYLNHGYGNLVIVETPIDNTMYIQTRYAHLHRTKVQEQQQTRQGQVIGTVGSSGNSTSEHLHFEIIKTNWPFREWYFHATFMNEVPGDLYGEMVDRFGEERLKWLDPLTLINKSCE